MPDVHYTGSPNKYNTVTAYTQIMWSSEMQYHTASSFRLKVRDWTCGQIICDMAVKLLELFYCRHSCTLTGYPRDHLPSCPVTMSIFETFMKLLFQSNPLHCCHVFMNCLAYPAISVPPWWRDAHKWEPKLGNNGDVPIQLFFFLP